MTSRNSATTLPRCFHTLAATPFLMALGISRITGGIASTLAANLQLPSSATCGHIRDNPLSAYRGGLILLGAVGAGIYYLCKSDCCKRVSNDEEEPDFEHPHGDIKLPPYIS